MGGGGGLTQGRAARGKHLHLKCQNCQYDFFANLPKPTTRAAWRSFFKTVCTLGLPCRRVPMGGTPDDATSRQGGYQIAIPSTIGEKSLSAGMAPHLRQVAKIPTPLWRNQGPTEALHPPALVREGRREKRDFKFLPRIKTVVRAPVPHASTPARGMGGQHSDPLSRGSMGTPASKLGDMLGDIGEISPVQSSTQERRFRRWEGIPIPKGHQPIHSPKAGVGGSNPSGGTRKDQLRGYVCP